MRQAKILFLLMGLSISSMGFGMEGGEGDGEKRPVKKKKEVKISDEQVALILEKEISDNYQLLESNLKRLVDRISKKLPLVH